MSKAALKKSDIEVPSNVITLKNDPIFDAITRHKIAHLEHEAACELHSLLEDELPSAVCKSFYRKIVKTDDPLWIACNKRITTAMDRKLNAAKALAELTPTSLAGIIALLKYAALYVEKGNCWPDSERFDDDVDDFDWSARLHRNLAQTLANMFPEGEGKKLPV